MINQIITSEQRKEFLDKGFLVIPNALPANLLSKLRDLIPELNEDMQRSQTKSSLVPQAGFIEAPGNPLLARINDLLAFYPEAVFDLLALPIMISIAGKLCGPDAVPLQWDVLFKHKHPEPLISWHQDALHPGKYPYLNIGIYLDDADLGDGCLDYVANSQHEAFDIRKMTQNHGWNIPGMVSIPVKAGAILIQDMMVLHASQVKKNEGVRRTIYVEMRPAAPLLDQGSQGEKWTVLPRRWMGIVQRKSTVEWPDKMLANLPKDLKSDPEEMENILQHREPPIPAYYGFPTSN